jgi:hypothetical protein
LYDPRISHRALHAPHPTPASFAEVPGSSISSSERLVPAPAPLTPTSPGFAESLPLERGPQARGAGALVGRAVALLLVAALPVAFSAWVDPGRLVAHRRSEREIARALAAGANVTNFVNYDDRAIEKYLVPLRNGRVDVLALGSSRTQPLTASAFPGSVFVNGSMQGGMLDDAIGVYGLYDHAERRPRRVVLNVDPWVERFDARSGWLSIADERDAVLRRAGIPVSPLRDRLKLIRHTLRTLVSPEYFRMSVFSFRRHGPRGVHWRISDRAQNAEKTKLPNGTVVWSDLPADNAERVAPKSATLMMQEGRFPNFDWRKPGRRDALERFVRYLQSEGITVTMVLVPFTPEVYDTFVRLPGIPVTSVERDLHAMAARTGAQVAGSYDPRRAGVVTRDFFDGTHLRPEPLARLLSR